MPLVLEASATGILSFQNQDGGWSYRRGTSWTEPTVFALLALSLQQPETEGFRKGMRWVCRQQRPDGGWAPNSAVDQSTWVTSLAVLLLNGKQHGAEAAKGADWLLSQRGKESTWIYRWRRTLLGSRPADEEILPGWPWYPGAAAWVVPTSLTLLALSKVERSGPDSALRSRLEQGRQYLLSRICQDGGWNHGSTRALGYEANSYPETTGLVLLALHGVPLERLDKSLAVARQYLGSCRSPEGLSWLQLGLQAHNQECHLEGSEPVCRTVPDAALRILARAATKGRNVFLEQRG